MDKDLLAHLMTHYASQPSRGRKSAGDENKIVSGFVKAQRAIIGTRKNVRIEVFVYAMAPHGKNNGTRDGRNSQRMGSLSWKKGKTT